MSLHRVSLHMRQKGEEETLVGIIDALYGAVDLTKLIALAASTGSDPSKSALHLGASLLEDALGKIVARVEAVMHGRPAR